MPNLSQAIANQLKNINVGDVLSGFRLKKQEYIEEIQSHVLLFEYEKTATELVAVKNDDENKNFCIGFKTLPSDSTGVPHILEHSVLSGSKKYPIKDVFSELTKGSLTTFINAMTYSDKTLYPFATRNEQEYFNIMDVYCDLTLNPLLEKDTFLQEGWHIELEDSKDPLKYNGIVYNEMKGAYSSPLRILYEMMSNELMPQSTYAVSSGGWPNEIVDLTFENFKKFHEKNYHPSNAKLTVYGNASLEKELSYLHENFLQHFDKRPIDNKINLGKALVNPQQKIGQYAITESEMSEDKTYLSLAVSTGFHNDPETNMAMNLLCDILLNSESSLLKLKLLEAGVGKEVGCMYEDIYKSFIMIYVMGANSNQKDDFVKVYRDTLAEIIKNGFDKELIDAQINSYEFKLKEDKANTKRGLEYTLDIMAELMYDNDIFSFLKENEYLKIIKEKIKQGNYFEDLIEKYLLNNNEMVVFTLEPDVNKAKNEAEAVSRKLANIKSELSKQALEKLVEQSKSLKEKQALPNSAEAINLLPKLKLHDIKPNLTRYWPQRSEYLGTDILISEQFTNGIGYFNIGFDLRYLDADLLPYLNIFTELLCELGTESRDYLKLANELDLYTGGFYSTYQGYYKLKNEKDFTPYLWFNLRVLFENYDKAFAIITDLFLNTKFSNEKRITEILKRMMVHEEYSLTSDGYSFALSKMGSMLSTSGRYNEEVNGYPHYCTLKKLSENFDQEKIDFFDKMKKLQQQLIQQNTLKTFATVQQGQANESTKQLQSLINSFPRSSLTIKPNLPASSMSSTAYHTSAEVVYTGQGANLFLPSSKSEQGYSGALEVLLNYLDNDYLYSKIRVIGGAYGNFSKLNKINGNLLFISYRDPNVKKTYDAYASLDQEIKNLEINDSLFDQIKINSYAKFDPLLSPMQKGIQARSNYLMEIDENHTKIIVDQILSCTKQDMQKYAQAFSQWNKNSVRCAIGNSQKLTADKNLFDQSISL